MNFEVSYALVCLHKYEITGFACEIRVANGISSTITDRKINI